MQARHSDYYPVIHWRDFKLKLFIEGVFVGLLSGMVGVAFRFVLEKADLWRAELFPWLREKGPAAIVIWFVILAVIAVILGFLGRKEPMAVGSGIPQVKGELVGHLKMNWTQVLAVKFAGGILAIGAGLSLGREGPSVQLGAVTAKGFSRFFKRLRIEEKYLMTSGAGAGLAAAFSAPLAGVIFSLEELHKNFSPAVLMSAMSASLTADFVAQKFFGQSPVFDFPNLPVLPINAYGYLIGLGVVAGVLGSFFNVTLLSVLRGYDRFTRIPQALKIMFPLFLAGVLGFILPQVLGGGNALVDSLADTRYTLGFLVILWMVKFLFTMLSFGSGVPGGIFLPLLVLGALTGNIYAQVMQHFFHFNPEFINNFIVFAMAAYFTAIVKAPITGSILITEMTGTLEHMFALVAVSMTAYLISDLLKTVPVYDSLLDRILAKQAQSRSEQNEHKGKVITEASITLNSKLAGRMVREITWPPNCLLVSIKRGDKEIIPKGESKLMPGDFIYVLTDENQTVNLQRYLFEMAEEQL